VQVSYQHVLQTPQRFVCVYYAACCSAGVSVWEVFNMLPAVPLGYLIILEDPPWAVDSISARKTGGPPQQCAVCAVGSIHLICNAA
jgi:hypothetical protein